MSRLSLHVSHEIFERGLRALASPGGDPAAAGAVEAALDSVLDAGCAGALREARAAARRLGRRASAALESSLDRVSQRCSAGGEGFGLFCLPLLVDLRACGPMPAGALRRLLDPRGREAGAFVLLEGWVHPDDLAASGALGRRALARAMAEALRAGQALCGPPPGLFARFPAGARHAEGALDSSARAAGALAAPRLALGLARRGAARAGGRIAPLLDGHLPAGALAALAGGLEAGVDGLLALADPGGPVEALARVRATLECMRLEDRIERIRGRTGLAPICHVCVSGNRVLVAMTLDGDLLLDRAELDGAGLDADFVAEIVMSRSRGVVHHPCPASLPAAPRPGAGHH